MSGARVVVMVAAWLAGAVAVAQAQNPFIEAAREAAAPAAPLPTPPEALVQAFIDGCVAHEGDATKTVDWAITQGFVPVDAQAAATLLAGRPGTVLGLPGSAGQALLAIDLEQRCTVWAEQADGPALRAALVKALGALVAQGARAQPLQERRLERAGAWRLQLLWRFRRAGGDKDLGLGSVTTLGAQPAAQALSLGPIAAAAEPATR
jgi:hypothetical protein